MIKGGNGQSIELIKTNDPEITTIIGYNKGVEGFSMLGFLIAKPGTIITIKNRKLYFNGVDHQIDFSQPQDHYLTTYPEFSQVNKNFKINVKRNAAEAKFFFGKVPAEKFLVLEKISDDNTEYSWSIVPRKNIVGRVEK